MSRSGNLRVMRSVLGWFGDSTRVRFLALVPALGIVSLVLASCTAESAPPLGPAATPTSTTMTADTIEPSTTTTRVATTTTLDAAEERWLETVPYVVKGNGTARYRTSVFSAPFSLVPAQGWIKQAEAPDRLTATQHDNITFLAFAAGFSSTDEAVEAYEIAAECFGASMTQPAASSVGGAEGVTFEILGLPQRTDGADNACTAPLTDPTGTFVAGARQALFHVADVDGVTVTIIYWTLPTHYQDYTPSIDSMIDSIVWKDLG